MPVTDKPRIFAKSYFAASVDQAMERAHNDLGAEALLLNTRQSPPEARHLGEWEVVFGVSPAVSSEETKAKAAVDPVEDLRRGMQELRELVGRMGSNPVRENAGHSAITESLVQAGIPRQMATDIDAKVRQRMASRDVTPIVRPRLVGTASEVLQRETLAELESRFTVLPELGRITALVGPPGSGKTSTLVKLAVTKGLLMERPVRLISTDCYRIAAADQLRTFASILGVPFTLVETPAALAQAIDAAPKEALLLIDTPGWSATALQESGAELAAFLSKRQDIDTHLVLTASMRQADLERAANGYAIFRPSKLLFTKLDETDSTAAMFCEAARTKKPLSFFSAGQLIPEDLEPATVARVTSALVRELPLSLEAVA